MALKVIQAGLQSSLQGHPFSGHRHIGMPAAGAADSLSLSLANQLVDKPAGALAIEITMTATNFEVSQRCVIAVTGAAEYLKINAIDYPLHQSIIVSAGNYIEIGPAQKGCRSYLALDADIDADNLLGGGSTYLPAKLGGFHGRALKAGDIIAVTPTAKQKNTVQATPTNLQPILSNGFVLRVTEGPEYDWLAGETGPYLFSRKWSVSLRSSRMGMALKGAALQIRDAQMQSAAVFPGTIQCPPDGLPYLLGPDAQTTGGYPRIAQIIRADRHLIGQIRPGSEIQLVKISPEQAAEIYRQKLTLLKPWLGDIKLW